MPMQSWMKFPGQRNISGASQQSSFTAPSKTTEVDEDVKKFKEQVGKNNGSIQRVKAEEFHPFKLHDREKS